MENNKAGTKELSQLEILIKKFFLENANLKVNDVYFCDKDGNYLEVDHVYVEGRTVKVVE